MSKSFFESLNSPILQTQGFKVLLDYKLVVLPEESIYFDPTNYRLNLKAQQDKSEAVANVGSQEWLYDSLCAEREHEETAEGMRQTKGSYDDILVAEEPVDKVLRPVAFEGNRTLAVYRKHHRAGVAGFDKIRCKVFKKLDLKQRRMLLAVLHIKSKKRWGSYNDAHYIADMIEDSMSIDQIAKHLGKTKVWINEYLNAFRLHDRIQQETGKFDPDFFTISLRFVKAPELMKEYERSENGRLFKWFSECVSKKRFGYTGNLNSTELKTLYADPTLRQTVLDQGITAVEHALKVIQAKGKGQLKEVIKGMELVPDLLSGVSLDEWESVREGDENFRLKAQKVMTDAQVAINTYLPYFHAVKSRKGAKA